MPDSILQADDPNPDNVVACFIRELMDKYLVQFPEIEETEEEYDVV